MITLKSATFSKESKTAINNVITQTERYGKYFDAMVFNLGQMVMKKVTNF